MKVVEVQLAQNWGLTPKEFHMVRYNVVVYTVHVSVYTYTHSLVLPFVALVFVVMGGDEF